MGSDQRSRRWRRALPAVVGAAAMVVFGRVALTEEVSTTQPAATQPASNDTPPDGGERSERDGFRGRGMRGQGPFGGGPMGFGRRYYNNAQVETDPSEAIQFMSEHAPKYWAWISNGNFPDDRRKGVESTIIAAYASYQKLKPDDPELYKVIVQRVEVEDKLFALRMKARQLAPGSRESLLPEIRAQVTASTDLNFKERQLRLARLRRSVDREEKNLATDTASRSDVINQRVEATIRGPGGGGMPFPGGGGGFRGDGNRSGSNIDGGADNGGSH